ncbi:nitrate/nitrite transporter [Chloroflexota bacterium]
MTSSNITEPNYRWYILIVGTITQTLVVGVPWQCMPVLFKEISNDLGLSLVQIGTVWGLISLAGALSALIGGLLGDRFGIKPTLTVACLLAGLTGALRGLSSDFVSLAVTMFLFGFIIWMIPLNAHRITAVWFSGRYMGMANGILSVGISTGYMIGPLISSTILSPLFGGWRNVLFFYSVVSIAIGLIWMVTGREPREADSLPNQGYSAPFRQALSHVVRIKSVWILGFILIGQMGCIQGVSGYLPLYLRASGWTVASADSTLAVLAGTATMATIPYTLISDRLGLRKFVLIPTLSVAAIITILLWKINGPAIWALIILIGLLRGGFMALLITVVIETKDIGATYAGTAQGLMTAVSQFGGFIGPPVGNSLANFNMGLPFAFWGVLSGITLPLFYFIPETGRGKNRPRLT